MTSNLRSIRIRLGMTQRELADVFGQTASNISHYEMGKQELPPACARALISYAKDKNHALTFEEIYDLTGLSTKQSDRLSDDCGRRNIEARRTDADRRSPEPEQEAA